MSVPLRIGVSCACASLAIALLLLISLLRTELRSRNHEFEIQMFIDFALATLLFSFPGWLISLPFVIALKNAEGWRLWVILLVGISIGPAFLLLAIAARSNGGPIVHWQGDGFFFGFGSAISVLATSFYVAALKLHRRRQIRIQAASQPRD